jgi:tetratricopeptide (TPR) repeat protein
MLSSFSSLSPGPKTKKEPWKIGILLAALYVWTLAPLAGFDFWFYLSVGRDIVEQGRIPWSESYLGTTSELAFGRYGDQAWLGNLLCYAAWSALGPLGLVLLKSALLTMTTALVYLSNRLLGLTPFWAAAWAALGLWTIRSRFEMRTYLFTDLALAMLVVLLVAQESKPNLRRSILAIAPLFAVWSNLHQGIIAGYIVLVVYLFLGRSPWKHRLSLAATAGLSSMARPHPMEFPGFLYDTLSNTSAIGGVIEWAPPSQAALVYQLGPFYLVILILGLSGALQRWRRGTLPPWAFGATALLFATMGLKSIRSISELLPVVCPLAAAYFPSHLPTGRPQKLAAVGIALLFLASSHPDQLLKLQDTSSYPSHLVDALPQDGRQVFNSFEYGNYLVFRRVPPFLHGMTAFYKEKLITDFKAVLNPTPQRQAILEQFGVDSFLLHLPDQDDATYNLVETLGAAPDWKLELWDDTGVLFVRGPRGEGLTHFQPWRVPAWTDASAAERELSELVQRRPSAIAHRALSQLLLDRNDLDGAIRQARMATEMSPYFYAAWAQLGLCYAKAGNLEGVLQASAQGVRSAGGDAPARFNRALALTEQARRESGLPSVWHRWQARYHLQRALWLDPAFAPARKLANQL